MEYYEHTNDVKRQMHKNMKANQRHFHCLCCGTLMLDIDVMALEETDRHEFNNVVLYRDDSLCTSGCRP